MQPGTLLSQQKPLLPDSRLPSESPGEEQKANAFSYFHYIKENIQNISDEFDRMDATNSSECWRKIWEYIASITVTLAMIPQGFFGGILVVSKILNDLGLGNDSAANIVRLLLLPLFVYTSLMGKRQIVAFFSTPAFLNISKKLETLWHKITGKHGKRATSADTASIQETLSNILGITFRSLYALISGMVFGGLARISLDNKNGLTYLLNQIDSTFTREVAKYVTSQSATQIFFIFPAFLSNLVGSPGIVAGGIKNLGDILKFFLFVNNSLYIQYANEFKDKVELARLELKNKAELALSNSDENTAQQYVQLLSQLLKEQYAGTVTQKEKIFTGFTLDCFDFNKVASFASKQNHPLLPARTACYTISRRMIPLIFTAGACAGLYNFFDLGEAAFIALSTAFGAPESFFENQGWNKYGAPAIKSASFSYMCLMAINVVYNVGRDFVDYCFGRRSFNPFRHAAHVNWQSNWNPFNLINPIFWLSKCCDINWSSNWNPFNWINPAFLADKIFSNTVSEKTLQLIETAFVCLLGVFPNVYQAVMDKENPEFLGASGWASFALEFSGYLFLLIQAARLKLPKENPFASMVAEVDDALSQLGDSFGKHSVACFETKTSESVPPKYRSGYATIFHMLQCCPPDTAPANTETSVVVTTITDVEDKPQSEKSTSTSCWQSLCSSVSSCWNSCCSFFTTKGDPELREGLLKQDFHSPSIQANPESYDCSCTIL